MGSGFAGEFHHRFYSCSFVSFDSIAPALSPFGPTIGCSLTCIAPDAAPPPGANFQLLFLRLAQAFGSRIRPDARLWLVSLQPRTACSLLKWEQLTLCALCVLRGSNAFRSSAVRDNRYNVSREKFSEIFLKPAPLQPMPGRVMVAQVWNHKLNE